MLFWASGGPELGPAPVLIDEEAPSTVVRLRPTCAILGVAAGLEEPDPDAESEVGGHIVHPKLELGHPPHPMQGRGHLAQSQHGGRCVQMQTLRGGHLTMAPSITVEPTRLVAPASTLVPRQSAVLEWSSNVVVIWEWFTEAPPHDAEEAGVMHHPPHRTQL